MEAVFVNILSPGNGKVVQGDPWAKGIIVQWDAGSGSFEAYGAWKEKCNSSPGRLQRVVKLALNRYAWCAWRAERGRIARAMSWVWLERKSWETVPTTWGGAHQKGSTKVVRLALKPAEGHDFFYTSGERSWERFLEETEWRVCFGRMSVDEFEGWRYIWVMLIW